MDAFYERLLVRAATFDELFSPAFETLTGLKGDADLAAQRLATWCRACASGDWFQFTRRLKRDGLSLAEVLASFATVRRRPFAPTPAWIDDAIWIESALQSQGGNPPNSAASIAEISTSETLRVEPLAFEHLLSPVAEKALAQLWMGIDEKALANLTGSAHADLCYLLLKELSGLCAAPLYAHFSQARKTATTTDTDNAQCGRRTFRYDHFVADMKAGGFRRLFEERPVLLRLLASITRQWIDASREFIVRLDSDLAAVRHDILHFNVDSRVSKIEGDLSDPHNGGRAVLIVRFEDDSHVVYKPKDLRVDVAWNALVGRLNRSGAPVELKTAGAVARDGYGWTEFIAHTECAEVNDFKRFFRRSGAWLALFHCFAGADMHQENIIAAGDHPVPIDLEMILQAATENAKTRAPEAEAFEAAHEIIANSVMSVGLLPAYAKSPENKVFAFGGMTSDWTARTKLKWRDINSDVMRPVKSKETDNDVPNLPHVQGRYAKLGDYIDDLVEGFRVYATFMLRWSEDARLHEVFEGFVGIPVRRVIRPTRFYYLLLQRLKNESSMSDGIAWSVQADFLARLSDWEHDSDPFWSLQRAERAALLALNVPHFVSLSDGQEISDSSSALVVTHASSGFHHAYERLRNFDAQEIAWQIEVIRQNTAAVARPVRSASEMQPRLGLEPTRERFLSEADRIASELSDLAIRRGSSAAWIGLDWLGDSELWQLVPLGADLYNGVAGIALFLSANAAITGNKSSGELALMALAHLRKTLKGRNSARMARSLGTGGAVGLGSVIYTFTVTAKLLRDDTLLTDAHAAAMLINDDLVAADKQLDVIAGSAGCILGLLRLYRDSSSVDVLGRAIKCGEHLLAQSRPGPRGLRSWVGEGSGPRALNGISHGAAGFAYALAYLAATTGRDDFGAAAAECIAYENASYDAQRSNWPDFRDGKLMFPCQWCHGATGIGLARIATLRRGRLDTSALTADIQRAVIGLEQIDFPRSVDTLCCGNLGNIEFLCEAGRALGRDELTSHALRRLMAVMENAAVKGDYCWNAGSARFNLGLFRGLAGLGYTLLRRADDSLPNVMIWE